MEDDEEENQLKEFQYIIPSNVSARFEFFEGFGWKELFACIAALLVAMGITFLMSIPKKTVKVKDTIGITNSTSTSNSTNLNTSTTNDLSGEVGNSNQNQNNSSSINEPQYHYEKVCIVPVIVRILILVLFVAVTFAAVIKSPATNNMSFVQLLMSAKEFSQKQKRYLYKYRSGSEER